MRGCRRSRCAQAQRTPNLVREAAGNFTLVLAQTAADAERMRQVGAGRVEVVGNLKFDFTPSPELVEAGRRLRASLGPRPVLLFASTREGEEPLILDALQALDARMVVLIVPRHPQRFDDVARLLASRGLNFARRSALKSGSDPDFAPTNDGGGENRGLTPIFCSATRWARWRCTTRRPTSRSSAAACCRSAART